MADFDWSRYVSGGATRPDSFSGMTPDFSSALTNMFASAPPGIQRQLGVSSGYRSPARQAQLYQQALQKYGSPAAARQWVAPPGNSQHNKGNAADLKYLSPQAKSWVKENAPSYGLSFPLGNEPWHIELSTARNPSAATRALNSAYVPKGDIPTPMAAPDIEGILGGSQPVSPQEYAAYSSPLKSVQRAPLKDVNNMRIQPTTQTVPELSYDRFSTTPFDMARFADPTQAAAGQNALRRGLLDQQLDAGILPSIDNPAYAAMQQPDPMVTGAAYAEPASIDTAAVQPPAFDTQTSLNQPGGLLSPQEQQAVAAQRAYLDQQPFNKAPSLFDRKGKQIGGGILGGILGGLTLGPAGAAVGGLLGGAVTRPGGLLGSDFPEKPQGQSRGDGSLTDYGRSVSNSSGQFSRAIASGKGGLY
jgi:hypothetical protein